MLSTVLNRLEYLRRATCSCMKSAKDLLDPPSFSIFTCWHIEINVGVKALLSGVVPKNLITQIGLTSANHSELVRLAALASSDVFPQPPSP